MDRPRIIVVTLALAAGCAAVWVTVKDYRAAHPARPADTAVAFHHDSGADPPEAPAANVSAEGPAEAAAGEAVEASGILAAPQAPGRSADALPRKARKPRAKPRIDSDARRSGLSTPAPRPEAQGAEPAAVARRALALVGSDEEAEEVWVGAINDPSRSAHERSDLIEDLNEEGFADPKHVTPDDLPLIENRLSLIEQLAPDAMDQVNADAFAEAYKDLVNMYIKAGGLGGQ